jgi:hypothetical protein
VIDGSHNTTYGYLSGLRPGVKLHVLLSVGGCNTTVVQDVIVPDFLPPSFTDVKRLEDSAAATDATADVRPWSWYRRAYVLM